MDCRLQRNYNKNRCRVLRKISGKDKKDLTWKEAKAKYPRLSPCGNADGDKVINKKDCRPFNKYMHMTKVTENGETVVLATPGEYKAYKKINYGRKMGLPPVETHKELKEDGLTSDEMRTGLALFEMSKQGTKIELDEGQMGVSQEYLGRLIDPEKASAWQTKWEMERTSTDW